MKQLITFLFCLFTLFAEAQVNPNDTTKYFKSYDYGFSYKRLQAREAFIMPTDTVINKLGAVSLNGAIYLGNGVKWTSIGGGTTPTLQQVTTAGNTTTNQITTIGLNLSGNNTIGLYNSDGGLDVFNTTNGELLRVTDGTYGYLKFGGGQTGGYVQINSNQNGNVELNVPSTSGTIPMSVNGYTANTAGNITIPSIDTTNQFVKRITRTPGKDSIIYFVGANRFAIKDSVGTNPAPVGYYGAWQDNNTQTAASSNVGYPLIYRTVDLENQVRVVTNGTNLTRIKFDNAGIYNVQFSVQIQNTDNAQHDVTIWLRKNGTDVVGSSGLISVPARKSAGAGNEGHGVYGWNYLLPVATNDYYEIVWSTSNAANVTIQYYAAGSPPPSTASVILTVTQQSGIMAGTGISPLDTANMLSPYARINLVNTKLNISDTSSMLSSYSTRINGKLNIADTSVMLAPYSRTNVVNASIATKVNISDTSAMLTNYARTNLVNTKVNISDTASMLTPYAKSNLVATKLNATDTASLSNRINQKPTDLDLLQSLGLGIKAEPYGCTYANVTSQLSLTSPRLYFYPFNWNVSDSIRGIAFLSRAATSLTATNYNGVAIYSLSGGTLTRLTFTPNSATFWDNATINSWKNVSITPYYLPKGTYFLGYEASGSAGTPTIASGSIMQAGFIEPPTAINTNGIKISSYISNATTTPPSSVAMSTTTIVHQVPYFILY